MNPEIQALLEGLQTLANERVDGGENTFEINFPGGKIEVAAKIVLDPLPDNVIPFPR